MSVVPSSKIKHAVLGGIFRVDITVMTLEGEWRCDKEDNVHTMSTNDNISPRFYPTMYEDLPSSIQCLADEIASTRQFNDLNSLMLLNESHCSRSGYLSGLHNCKNKFFINK